MKSTDGTDTSSNPKHQNSKHVCGAWHSRSFVVRVRINPHFELSNNYTAHIWKRTLETTVSIAEKPSSAKIATGHRHCCMTRYKLLLVLSQSRRRNTVPSHDPCGPLRGPIKIVPSVIVFFRSLHNLDLGCPSCSCRHCSQAYSLHVDLRHVFTLSRSLRESFPTIGGKIMYKLPDLH